VRTIVLPHAQARCSTSRITTIAGLHKPAEGLERTGVPRGVNVANDRQRLAVRGALKVREHGGRHTAGGESRAGHALGTGLTMHTM
jgi:hypothetical protein